MTVQKELTKNIYVGNGQTTKFPFTFECPDNHPEYIRVYVAGKKNELTETTNFGVDIANKSITYPANGEPLAIDEQLVIMRELPVRQLMNLVNNGPYFAEDIETAFDEGIMIAQQSSEKLGRALVAPPTSTTFDPQIPIEPGKTFRISDDGTHLETTEDPGKVIDEAKALKSETETARDTTIENKDIAVSAANDALNSQKLVEKYKALWFSSIAAMKAEKSLKPGATACTLGYYSPNDGGGGTYYIRAKAEGDADDGGSLHELANGNVAELVVENGTVNVKQFGAKGDGVTDDSDSFTKAINAYAIIDLLNEKYCLLNTVNINKNIVLKNGSLYMPSSDKFKQVFWMPYVNDANLLTVQFEFIRFSSVRDKKTITFKDTELTSNLLFFQNKETQPCKLIFKNCDIAQCEYCVKKDDSTNELFVVKNCYFHDSLMPIYSNGHFLDIRNSDIECIATNKLYHCVYLLLHNVNDVDIKAYNCHFINKNMQGGQPFQAYVDTGIEYSKSEKIPIYLYSCILSDALGIGRAGASIYTHCTGYFTACSLGLTYNGVYNNCTIYTVNNNSHPYVVINNSVLHIVGNRLVINSISDVVSICNSFIVAKETEDEYPLYIMAAGKDLPQKHVTIINSYFDDATTNHLIRLTDANLILLNNTITRQSSITARLIYATGDSTTTIAGNVVRANDSSFPTENNIVIPIQ